MEIYFEQSILNPNIDKHQKRTSILKIVRIVLLVIAAALAFLFLFTPGDKGWGLIIMNVVFYVLLIIPFILGFIFITRFIAKSNQEYDYVISGTIFRVVTVVNRLKRKKMLEIPISCIESIGRITGDAYDRYASDKTTKKQFAICEFDDEDEIFYMYYNHNGERHLLHIAPNEEMIICLRRCVSRISIIDKSAMTSVKKSPKPTEEEKAAK